MFRFKNGREYVTNSDFNLLHSESNNIDKKYISNEYITIEFSNRLKACAGKAEYKNEKYIIKLSVDYYNQFGVDRTLKTLRHEFAHIIDHIKCGYMSHEENFKRICCELGGSMNPKIAGFTYAASATDQYIRPVKSKIYIYICPGCNAKTTYKKKMSDKIRFSNTHHCCTCKTPVYKFKEEIIYN